MQTENSEKRIHVVDDEEDILELLRYNLEKAGYQVEVSDNGQDAIETARSFQPHLILLDIMMPGMDGIETCKEMRTMPTLKNVLIAFLTARSEDYSQIEGFEAGADDYIAKPIEPKVLNSRIKALLRRPPFMEEEKTTESTGDIQVDRDRYIVQKGEKEFSLPRKEFELLNLLIGQPGRVFSRDEILNAVWGTDVVVGDRTIDVHIRKLREKLGEEHIVTVQGVGYKLE